MRTERPTLDELPDPPPEKTGWPWTEQTDPLPETQRGGEPWPTISVVTPSYNQAQFIEETIRSVLLQGHPNLEYVVMDGGSTDGSVEIIEKYGRWIDYWASEADRGQSHAINKGFSHCSGQLATFINSDDMLVNGALCSHAKQAGYEPQTIYVGKCRMIDAKGKVQSVHESRIRSFEDLIDIPNVWRGSPPGQIVQMETIFPLDMYKSIGGLDESLEHCMDYKLWGDLLLDGAEIQYTGIEIGMFRRHDAQKTADWWRTVRSLVRNAVQLVEAHPGWSRQKKEKYVRRLKKYEKDVWYSTGILARTGLPEPLVLWLRDLRDRIPA